VAAYDHAFRRAAMICSTSDLMLSSTTAKISSTVRPEAAMRARKAALTVRIASGRSSGV
jgi:hypothetical protein